MAFVEPETFGDAAGFRGNKVKFSSSHQATPEDHSLVKSLMHGAWKETCRFHLASDQFTVRGDVSAPHASLDASLVRQLGLWRSSEPGSLRLLPVSSQDQLTQLPGPQRSSASPRFRASSSLGSTAAFLTSRASQKGTAW